MDRPNYLETLRPIYLPLFVSGGRKTTQNKKRPIHCSKNALLYPKNVSCITKNVFVAITKIETLCIFVKVTYDW